MRKRPGLSARCICEYRIMVSMGMNVRRGYTGFGEVSSLRCVCLRKGARIARTALDVSPRLLYDAMCVMHLDARRSEWPSA